MALALSTDAELLLAQLDTSGAAQGNGPLRGLLDWEESRYLCARDELLDAGLAQRWRGRGGSLRRVPADDQQPTSQQDEAEYEDEKDLYPPMAAVLGDKWIKDNRLEPAIVAAIPHQGKRKTGGKWTRPDLVVVSVQTLDLVPGRHMTVATFEVKRGSAADLTAVYEALGHRRCATHSFLIVHAEGLTSEMRSSVAAEATRHGIGFIVADDPANYETWDTMVDAERASVDPRDLDGFLRVQLPEDARAQVREMLG